MKKIKPKSCGSLFHLWLASIISISIIPQLLCAQGGVGIGTDNPSQAAILHIEPPGNNKGLLIPRLTTAEISNIPGEEGLLVYDTSTFALKVYTQGAWSNVGTPRGAIIMWSGVTPPAGWALCDGQAGRPNLQGRFVVGYNPSVTDYNAIDNIGGNSSITLTAQNMPRHTHSLSINSGGEHTHFYDRHTSTQVGSNSVGSGEAAADPGGQLGTITTSSGNHNHTGTIGFSGGTIIPAVYGTDLSGVPCNVEWVWIDEEAGIGFYIQTPDGCNPNFGQQYLIQAAETVQAVPYDNRPPYYVLAYIIKL
jgi:microcystin-dependent protein